MVVAEERAVGGTFRAPEISVVLDGPITEVVFFGSSGGKAVGGRVRASAIRLDELAFHLGGVE